MNCEMREDEETAAPDVKQVMQKMKMCQMKWDMRGVTTITEGNSRKSMQSENVGTVILVFL